VSDLAAPIQDQAISVTQHDRGEDVIEAAFAECRVETCGNLRATKPTSKANRSNPTVMISRSPRSSKSILEEA
jgi:hypothetical protein